MNVLITGGAGFIGSKLALDLDSKDYCVTVLDNLLPQIHGENPAEDSPLYKSIFNKINFVKGDVTNINDWKKVIPGQHIIIHLAAETGTGQSMYSIEKYTDTNIRGTAIMLDLLVNNPNSVQKIIFASSRALYGEGKYKHPDLGIVYPKNRKINDMVQGDFEVKYYDNKILELLPTDEESKLHPTSVYGITKHNQEQMIMTVCSTIGIEAVSLRFQNVYGAGQSLLNPYTGILSVFSAQIINNQPVNIFEDGKESRDFIYIDDAIEAIITSLESEKANGKIFNVGTGIATSVFTVAKKLTELYKKDVPTNISGQFRLGDIRHNFADISKINSLLNFQPKISFDVGIEKFTSWVCEQKINDSELFNKSLEEMKSKGLLK